MANANQPAFPLIDPKGDIGLSKREYFAAVAMQGLLANPHLGDAAGATPGDPDKNLAITAIRLSDALLKQLEK